MSTRRLCEQDRSTLRLWHRNWQVHTYAQDCTRMLWGTEGSQELRGTRYAVAVGRT
jgi:hypothetical protein